MNKRFTVFVVFMVLAMVMAGGAFAQVVVGVGANYSSEKTDTGTTTGWSEFTIPLSAGYRMGAMGFGVDFSYSGMSTDPSPTPPNAVSSDLEIGGYFEYAFLQGEKLSFWGKAGLGYTGTFDEVSGVYLGNWNGFYLKITPALEYKMFKYVSVFASCVLIDFTYSSWKAEKWGASGSWVSMPSGMSFERSRTNFRWPITKGIDSITIGAKVVF